MKFRSPPFLDRNPILCSALVIGERTCLCLKGRQVEALTKGSWCLRISGRSVEPPRSKNEMHTDVWWCVMPYKLSINLKPLNTHGVTIRFIILGWGLGCDLRTAPKHEPKEFTIPSAHALKHHRHKHHSNICRIAIYWCNIYIYTYNYVHIYIYYIFMSLINIINTFYACRTSGATHNRIMLMVVHWLLVKYPHEPSASCFERQSHLFCRSVGFVRPWLCELGRGLHNKLWGRHKNCYGVTTAMAMFKWVCPKYERLARLPIWMYLN